MTPQAVHLLSLGQCALHAGPSTRRTQFASPHFCFSRSNVASQFRAARSRTVARNSGRPSEALTSPRRLRLARNGSARHGEISFLELPTNGVDLDYESALVRLPEGGYQVFLPGYSPHFLICRVVDAQRNPVHARIRTRAPSALRGAARAGTMEQARGISRNNCLRLTL